MRLLLAFLVGLGLAASFPEINFPWLAWLAPGLILLATRGGSGRQTFGFGYIAAAGHYLVSLNWLVELPFPWLRVVAYVATVAVLSVFLAAWCWVCWRSFEGGFLRVPSTCRGNLEGRLPMRVRRLWRCVAWAIFCAAAWVAMEMVIARVLTGFPWNFLGVSQFRFLPLIQIASFTGVYGVSFLVVWVSVTGLILFRPDLRAGLRVLQVAPVLLAPPLLVTLGVIGFGMAKLSEAEPFVREVKIALVQPAIPQEAIWDANEKRQRFDKLIELSRAALAAEPDLLVWPETAMPDLIGRNAFTQQALRNLLRDQRAWIVMGGGDVRPVRGSKDAYFNAAFLIDDKGELVSIYHKRHLVLFGEYMPGARRFPSLAKLRRGGMGMTPGNQIGEFEIDSLALKFNVLICFEDVFPHEVRSTVNVESDFLLNLTNDGWFGDHWIQRQHAISAMFRAIENGLPLVRCANNGLTCWVDARGRLHEEFFPGSSDIYQAGFKTARVPLRLPGNRGEGTFYNRHGDWFGWCCVSLSLIVLIWSCLQSRELAGPDELARIGP